MTHSAPITRVHDRIRAIDSPPVLRASSIDMAKARSYVHMLRWDVAKTNFLQGPGQSNLWGAVGSIGDCTISMVSSDRASNHIHGHSWAELAGWQHPSCGLSASPRLMLCALPLIKVIQMQDSETACVLTGNVAAAQSSSRDLIIACGLCIAIPETMLYTRLRALPEVTGTGLLRDNA